MKQTLAEAAWKDAPMARRLFTRRQLLAAMGVIGLVTGGRFGASRLARPLGPSGPLSQGAQELIAQAWAGLDPAKVLDVHAHVVGTGDSGSGCWVSPRMTTLASPIELLKFTVYREAAGVTHEDHCDEEFTHRLVSLVSSQKPHGRLLLLAFDHFHDDDGRPVEAQSEFHTPDAYVLSLAKAHPELFVPAASIHPYRADAVSALESVVAQGAMAVKWLPNAMNIDPSSAKCDAFYAALARLQVPLITHAGEEKAVHAEERQRLGNPLHLRRALEHGVTVVVAHCASLGQNPDLDAAGEPWVDNFELFLRLMADPKWEGKLFGDLSALALVNRVGKPLQHVLEHDALQGRLCNGSDWPLPAINVVMQTRAVVAHGFLTEAQRTLLNEIDQHDPLLMDFVLKRTVRSNGKGLRDDCFQVRREVFPRLA